MQKLFKEAPAREHRPGQPWSLPEAARHLGVSVRTLTRLEKRGKLRLIREIGRRVMVPDAEVQRLAT